MGHTVAASHGRRSGSGSSDDRVPRSATEGVITGAVRVLAWVVVAVHIVCALVNVILAAVWSSRVLAFAAMGSLFIALAVFAHLREGGSEDAVSDGTGS